MSKIDTPLALRLSEGAQEKIKEIIYLLESDPNIQTLQQETYSIVESVREQLGALPDIIQQISLKKIKKIPKQLRENIHFSRYGISLPILLSGCKDPVDEAIEKGNKAMEGHSISTDSLQELVDGGSSWIEQQITQAGEIREVIFYSTGKEILYIVALAIAGKILGDLKDGSKFFDKTSVDEMVITVLAGLPTQLLLEIFTELSGTTNMALGGLAGLIAAGLIRVLRERGNCP